MTAVKPTVDAIIEASNYPMSIIIVGVDLLIFISDFRLETALGRQWRSLTTKFHKGDLTTYSL